MAAGRAFVLASDEKIYVRNTAAGAGRLGVVAATELALAPFMVWHLGVEHYGLWVILQIFRIGGLLGAAELGFQGGIIRYLTRYHLESDVTAFRRLCASGMALFALIGLVVGLSVAAFAQYGFVDVFPVPEDNAGEMRLALTICGLGLFAQFFSLGVRAFFSSLRQYVLLEFFEVVRVLTFAGGVVVLLLSDGGVLEVVILDVVVQCGLLLVLVGVAAGRQPKLFSVRPSDMGFDPIRRVSQFTAYLFLNRTLGHLYNHFPQLFVALLLTPTHVAWFALVIRIPRLMRQFRGVLSGAILPTAIRIEAKEASDDLREFVLAGTRFGLFVMTPVAVFLIVFAQPILETWIGPDYAHLTTMFQAAAVLELAVYFISFGAGAYTGVEQFRRLLPYNALATISIPVVMLSLTDRFGLWAAFAAIAIAVAINTYANLRVIMTTHAVKAGEFAVSTLARPFLAAGVIAAVPSIAILHFLTPQSLVGLIAAGACVYVVYCICAYGLLLNPDERQGLKNIFNSFGRHNAT